MLASLGVDFDVHTADIDESQRPGESPDSLVQRLAREGMRPTKRHSLDRPGRGGKRMRPARTPSRVDVVDRLGAS